MYNCYFYKIYNSEDNKEYVGSTKQSLSNRMSDHRRKTKKGSLRKLHIHMKGLGSEKFTIVELDRREVKDKQEQFKIEMEWMEKVNSSLNDRRAQTLPEKRLEIARKYKVDHADKIKEDWAKYSESNRDNLKKKWKKYREDNKQILCDKSKAYYHRNKVHILEKKRLQRHNSD